MGWSRQRRQRGVTLVELMVVVLISGILAMLAITSMREHVSTSRSLQAVAAVQGIRAHQERYRGLNLVYLDVSQSGTWYPRDPLAVDGSLAGPFLNAPDNVHPDNARWHVLGSMVKGVTRYGHMVRSGLAGEAMTATALTVPGLTWPTPSEAWYVIQVVGDTDDDGLPSYFMASSLNGEVYKSNEAE